jgi:hypothetical protein
MGSTMKQLRSRSFRIGHRKRELVGQVVNMAEEVIMSGADPEDARACIVALTRAGYPPRVIENTLTAVQVLIRQFQKEE